MSEWREIKLKEICKFKYGANLPASSRIKGNYPVYGSSSIVSHCIDYYVKGPGIIVGRKGTVGKVQYSPTDFFPIDTTFYIEHNLNKVDLKFLYYRLQISGLDTMNSDAAVPGLNRITAINQRINLPPLPTQKKIAKILSNYHDLIENNLKQIKLLEESARLTYEEWFLRFRIDGKKLDIDPESGLPYGWEQSTLGSLVAFHGGYAFKSKDYEENQKYKIVTIKNVQDGYFISSTTDTISTIPDNIKPSQKLNNGDYIMSLTGNVGRICLVYGENYLLNQRVVKLEPRKSIDYSFLYSLFRHKNMLIQLQNISNGAAQQNLSPVNAAKIKLPTPDEEFREKFNNKIKPAIDSIISLNLQNQLLKEARVILLPRLMTGMIDTDDMDIAV